MVVNPQEPKNQQIAQGGDDARRRKVGCPTCSWLVLAADCEGVGLWSRNGLLSAPPAFQKSCCPKPFPQTPFGASGRGLILLAVAFPETWCLNRTFKDCLIDADQGLFVRMEFSMLGNTVASSIQPSKKAKKPSTQRSKKTETLAKQYLRELVGFVRHPARVTCLDCGFLALQDGEVTRADRILLHCKGTAGLPCHPDDLPADLVCTRSLWVQYELVFGGGSHEGVFDELERDRRSCPGYLKYIPGFSPKEHREQLLKRMDNKERIRFAVLGGIITLIVAWLAKHFGLKS